MAGQIEITNMALFCDFENIALGVRDKYCSVRRFLHISSFPVRGAVKPVAARNLFGCCAQLTGCDLRTANGVV